MPDALIIKYSFSSFPPIHKSCHSFRTPPAVLPSAQPGIMAVLWWNLSIAFRPGQGLEKNKKEKCRTTLRPGVGISFHSTQLRRPVTRVIFIFLFLDPPSINNRPIQSAELVRIFSVSGVINCPRVHHRQPLIAGCDGIAIQNTPYTERRRVKDRR